MGNIRGSSWVTSDGRADPFKPSLVERAKQRKVRAKSDPMWWAVDGVGSLGDAYDSYDVHLRDDGTFYCACSSSAGGEYRKTVCSHRTAVMLWRLENKDPWEQVEDAEDAEDVQSSGESPEETGEKPPTEETPTANPEYAVSDDDDSPGLDSEEEDTPPEQAPPTASVLPALSSSSEFDPYDLDWDNPPRPQELATSPDDHALPEKFVGFRPEQWHGIIETIEHLDDDVKVVFLAAPTGSGKSLVAAAVPQLAQKPFIYTCTTHTLQDQVLREFSYARVLKGRRNYPTLDEPNDPNLSAEECTLAKAKLPACPKCIGWQKGSSFGGAIFDDEIEAPDQRHCFHCHPWQSCPYRVAKLDAKHARMAVLNTSYFLTETMNAYGSTFLGWDLVIIDEADQIEEELMHFITVDITPRMRKDLGIGLPKKKTVESSWVEWIEDEVIPAIDKRRKELPIGTDLFGKPDLDTLRKRKSLDRLKRKMKMLLAPVPNADGEIDDDTPALASGWIYTGYEREDGSGDKLDENVTVTFKPVTVRDYAREYLWDRAKQFILMSATLFPEQDAYNLGLEDGEWAVVEIPSTFPKESRPVVIRGEVEVTKKTEREAYPILIRQLHDIMTNHPDERILVHSNSYKLTKELFFETRKRSEDARDRLYMYTNKHERAKALSDYLAHPRGVLIAPSFERGVDLQGDDCRVVVIAKVPWPYLGDKQVSARLYGTGKAGKIWYSVETIRSICQMTGRGMRSRDDTCVSYILDAQFNRLYWRNQRLFPKWWREAVVFDENEPRWREPLKALGVRH